MEQGENAFYLGDFAMSSLLSCPECGGAKLWKDDKRYNDGFAVQEYMCANPECQCRFTPEHNHYKLSRTIQQRHTMYSLKNTFIRYRHKLSVKLQNHRLVQVHFHTLRHWRATMEYHNTRDLLHTMAFLGHKKSDNTLLYVQLDEKLFKDQDDKFIIKAVHSVEEAIKLGEIGFQPYDIIDGVRLYRKRK